MLCSYSYSYRSHHASTRQWLFQRMWSFDCSLSLSANSRLKNVDGVIDVASFQHDAALELLGVIDPARRDPDFSYCFWAVPRRCPSTRWCHHPLYLEFASFPQSLKRRFRLKAVKQFIWSIFSSWICCTKMTSLMAVVARDEYLKIFFKQKDKKSYKTKTHY